MWLKKYKYGAHKKGSSALKCCCHMDLWWNSSSHLIIIIIFNISSLQHHLRKCKLTLLLGCHSAHFSRSLAFWLSVECPCPPLTKSSLPARLPKEPFYLSELKPGGPPWDLACSECLWRKLIGPHSPSQEPSDMNGLQSHGPPWVAFCHCSHGPASPPDSHKNRLIRMVSILIVPLGLHVNLPWSSPWASFVG